MSIIDDAVAAITPAPSEEDRAEARDRARSAASDGDWLSLILDHHMQLEDAFEQAKQGSGQDGFEQLALILTGHAIAEESVIYPAMDMTGETRHADHAYKEQVIVKKEMAALEQLAPQSQDYLDKLEQIRSAVAHHMVEEEGTWFPDLRASPDVDQQMLTKRYREEWDRYTGETQSSSAVGF